MAPILSRLGQAFGFGPGGGVSAPPSPVQASGGTETSPFPGGDGKFYKAHVFKSGGSFVVSKLSTSDKPSDINWFIIGGGGGGGCNRGGGGQGGGAGAGGAMSDMPFMPAPFRGAQPDVGWQAGSYTIQVGQKGIGRPQGSAAYAGGTTYFQLASSPPVGLSVPGGGRGGNEGGPGGDGGCGGGGCAGPTGSTGGTGGRTPAGAGAGNPVANCKGGNGSPADNNDSGAGGGGGVMDAGNRPNGGAGIPLRGMVCHPTTSIPPICGYSGPPSSPDGPFGGWVGGGGGSGQDGRGGNPGGGGPGGLRYAGGGTGPSGGPNSIGQDNSGGGGAGGGDPVSTRDGGNGLAIFRYEVDS